MFKAIRSYLRTNAELTSLLNEAMEKREETKRLLEIANADADIFRADASKLRDQAATHIVKIASLQEERYELVEQIHGLTNLLYGPAHLPGTADANGVPLADETECKVIQFSAKRTIQ